MHKQLTIVTGLGLLAVGCASTPAPRPVAQRTTLTQPTATVSAGVSITLSAGQAAAVRSYLASAAPPAQNGRGRGRNGGLPPGIAKNLERGKPLPPGLAKTYLPAQLVSTLPRLPTGLEYVVVAGKLLLVEAATQAVRDVLLDVAF